MIEDYINGQKIKQLCDFNFKEPNFKQYEKEYVVYADSEKYVDALSFIYNNSPNRFILVTHNGDTEIRPTGLPHNLIHWFAQNLDFKHDKISPIPIGLENPQWHPHKMDILFNAKDKPRTNEAFCQFNPGTKPDERVSLLKRVISTEIPAHIYSCVNGQHFNSYVNNLKQYKYCFCPRGNGIDTHRIWESLYMGCIPVVKRHTTHEFEDSDLPILFVDDWSDFNYQTPQGNFDSEILTMKYWNNKICSYFTQSESAQ